MSRAQLSLCLGVCLSAACSGQVSTPSDCAPVCSGGETCIEGGCRKLCDSDVDCGTNTLYCDSGVCLPVQEESAPPTITQIDGTGSSDSTAGHTLHPLRDRVVVIGHNLAGTTATLVGAAGSVTLVECDTSRSTRVSSRAARSTGQGSSMTPCSRTGCS